MQNTAHPAARPALSWEHLRVRLDRLRWLVPAALVALVIVNELGLARWVAGRFGSAASSLLEILIYGSVGPCLAYLLLTLTSRWLEERETRAVQAQALGRARAQVQRSHDLNDDALQTLFAASLALGDLAEGLPEATPEAAARFHEAEQAVNYAMEQLYAHQASSSGRGLAGTRR
jgi:hypothetical protein